jgi:hypothetical protein
MTGGARSSFQKGQPGGRFVSALEVEQGAFKRRKVREISGREHLALHDREVDLDLVEPTGMNRREDRDHGRPLTLEAFDGSWSAMCRSVVDNPEDASGGSIWCLRHHLGDQPIERGDPGVGFTAPEHHRAPHVPRGQVGPRPAGVILVFDPSHPMRGRRQSRMPAMRPSNTGFLVGRLDAVVGVSGRPCQTPA